ncbi:AI-2E family transporter [Cupriavidus respiraculi]|uniref:Transport protein YhhT n=1 Tax=Cupriavidus respiraculi TaxID=195930 RepID=A0ABM8WE87_9BURK|nr:AI-2E family transporter [Cupriavidus respiraculi]MBY4949743.1 AI-2E family transporter [Cupriavidus respiraculi]CAG9165403.1 Putative transport protein YhhT [Cupriavidus respiraculi]
MTSSPSETVPPLVASDAAAPVTAPDVAPPPQDLPEDEPATVAISVDAEAPQAIHRGSIALVVLATLATLYAMQVAKPFIIPVVLAVLVTYLLDPMVSALHRRRVPRSIGATFVLLLLVAALASLAYLVQGQVESIVDRLPEIARKMSRTLSELLTGDDSMWTKIRRAASVLGGAAQHQLGTGPGVLPQSTESLSSMVLAGSVSVFALAGQAAVVFLLSFFLLVSGDMFKRKFVKMAGRTLTQKKINVHMLGEINRAIQRYMVMLLVTNVALGLCHWLLLTALGVNNAGTWAIAAGALHLVPYFGSGLTAICVGVAAFMQFGTVGVVATAAGGSILIATLIGSVVTTWMTGRMAKMNPVAVFVALLLFTWLWGAWGMLLAIPIAVITKVVADHIEGLEVLAEFLGE